MTNEELIKALRCKSNDINDCTMCAYHNACYGGTLEEIAADALEAADRLLDQNTQRCEALRKQLRESHESYERHIAEQQEQIAKLYILLNNRINEIAELERIKQSQHETIMEILENLKQYHQRVAELEAQLQKEGEWIEQDDGNSIYHKCSVCGKNQYNVLLEMMQGDYHYCPNCGAKMNGERRDGAV